MSSRKYTAKKLAYGYSLGPLYAGFSYIAVPQKFVTTGVEVTYNGKQMTIKPNQLPVLKRTFPDQFGRGTYTLCYYIWDEPVA